MFRIKLNNTYRYKNIIYTCLPVYLLTDIIMIFIPFLSTT